MESSNNKLKSKFSNRTTTEISIRWKKYEIMGKVFLGLFGILVTFFIQYQQLRLSKAIEKTNKEFESSRLIISQGQLASTLIENIIMGNEKEKQIALAILETTSKKMFPRIMEALASGALDKSIRKKAIQTLG